MPTRAESCTAILKPENLFLLSSASDPGGDRPRVKVLDFGLARLLDGQTITTYGLALGTPSFMSPEQAAGRIDEIDGRTDSFSLAATGFRLRTGRRIHEGANAVELVRKMATLPAPRVSSLAPDASPSFARVVDRALSFRREDRYESAAAMREDVRRAIGELDGTARTQMAVSAVPSRSPSSEGTVNLSGSDPEISESQIATRKLAERAPAAEEFIRLPKRRSILPWIALVALVGIGARMWLFRAKGEPVAPAPAAQELAAPDAGELARNGASRAPPAASVVPPLPARSAQSSSSSAPVHAPPALAPSPSPSGAPAHHAPPPRVGPGNVHKLESGHHARRSTPAPTR